MNRWTMRMVWAAVAAVAVAAPAWTLRAEEGDGPKVPNVKAGGGEGDRGGEGGVVKVKERKGEGDRGGEGGVAKPAKTEGERREGGKEGGKWFPEWRRNLDRALRVKLTPEQQGKIDAVMGAAVKDITDNVLTAEQKTEMEKVVEKRKGAEGEGKIKGEGGEGKVKGEGGEGKVKGEGGEGKVKGEGKVREGGDGEKGEGKVREGGNDPKKPAGNTPSWW